VLFNVVPRYKLIEEPEELVNLLLGKIRVVASVLYFKSVSVLAFAGHKVWQWAQARVAYGDPHGVVPIFLQELHKHGLAVEATFAPSAKFYSVGGLYHVFPSAVALFKMAY